MSATFTPRTAGDRAVRIVDVCGRVTMDGGASSLRKTVRGQLAEGWRNIVLNLGEVSYIDSIGIGELVSAFTAVADQGGRLKLLNLTQRTKDLLQATKLYTVFDVFDDEAEAIASFAATPATAE